MSRPTRRTVLGGLFAGAVGTTVGIPLLVGAGGTTSTGRLLPSRARLPEPYTLPFRTPPVLRTVRSDASGDVYEITQRTADVEILPGLTTRIWAYNGTFPGPTIHSHRGRRTVVRHRNTLEVPTVVHLHGGHTPPEHDGYPTDLIMPAGMAGHSHEMMGHGFITHGGRDYVYPVDQRAATLWYHDHRMDFTGPAVWRGLAGFHLISDDVEDHLPLPRDERDIPVMIGDRSFGEDGSLIYPSLDPHLVKPGVTAPFAPGVLGDVILVNGVPWPYAEVRGARHRLRLLNSSNARRYRLVLDPPPPGGGGLVQIGTDGGLLAAPIKHDAIEMAPAQRFDVIIDFARYRPGQQVTLVNEFGEGRTRHVMRFRVGDRAADDSAIPARLAEVRPLRAAQAATTRTMVFQSKKLHDGMQGWMINGHEFTEDYIHAGPRLNTVEIWRLVSDFHHPIHLHLVNFQVLSRGTGPPGVYDHGWKDTVDLRPAEQMAIIVPFTGYRGKYVFHCHNVEHEDMRMMGNFMTHD